MSLDLTAYVRRAIPTTYFQAPPRHCPECTAEPPAGHDRCIGCHDPRRPR